MGLTDGPPASRLQPQQHTAREEIFGRGGGSRVALRQSSHSQRVDVSGGSGVRRDCRHDVPCGSTTGGAESCRRRGGRRRERRQSGGGWRAPPLRHVCASWSRRGTRPAAPNEPDWRSGAARRQRLASPRRMRRPPHLRRQQCGRRVWNSSSLTSSCPATLASTRPALGSTG